MEAENHTPSVFSSITDEVGFLYSYSHGYQFSVQKQNSLITFGSTGRSA